MSTATPIPTATPIRGNGVFKKDGSTIYHTDTQEYTGACGFIRFVDGGPAFGGEEGFRAEFCLDSGGGCDESIPVDATGYYEIPVADERKTGGGTIYVLKGQDEERASRGRAGRFDLEDAPDGNGVIVRIDFIECTVDDPDSQCTLDRSQLVQPDEIEVINDDGSISRGPTRFCPSP